MSALASSSGSMWGSQAIRHLQTNGNMNNKETVKQRYPDAMLHPIQPNPKAVIRWHIIPYPTASAIIGTGTNEDEAWADAAKRIEP